MTPEDRIDLPESPQPASMTQDSRRRLLRGGLAATPVLLTMASRPVMANTTCFPSSASVSANASRTAAGFACRGRSVGFWSQDTSFTEWPAPMASPGETKAAIAAATAEAAAAAGAMKDTVALPSTLTDSVVTAEPARSTKMAATTFNSVFGNQGGYGTKTLIEVLRLNSNSGRDGLACHLAAAYLNALKGLTPSVVLDVVTVKNIWTSFVSRGYFEPTAGIRWFADYAEPVNPRGGLIAWIKTTMPA